MVMMMKKVEEVEEVKAELESFEEVEVERLKPELGKVLWSEEEMD